MTAPPDGFPAPAAPPAALDHVGHAVADLEHALRIFRDLLGGAPVDDGGDEGCRWVELAWPGPGRVRLLCPAGDASPLARWIGGAAGRVHHLRFTCADPASVPGATPLADGTWEVPPDEATGTRLVLRSHDERG